MSCTQAMNGTCSSRASMMLTSNASLTMTGCLLPAAVTIPKLATGLRAMCLPACSTVSGRRRVPALGRLTRRSVLGLNLWSGRRGLNPRSSASQQVVRASSSEDRPEATVRHWRAQRASGPCSNCGPCPECQVYLRSACWLGGNVRFLPGRRCRVACPRCA